MVSLARAVPVKFGLEPMVEADADGCTLTSRRLSQLTNADVMLCEKLGLGFASHSVSESEGEEEKLNCQIGDCGERLGPETSTRLRTPDATTTRAQS